MSSEIGIATEKVYPYLLKDIGFAPSCIQGYGRVPIQIGGSVVWADYVCFYYTKSKQKKAFCVVEVKKCLDNDVDLAVPQAESYAQRLNAPYFCCTNGSVFTWYMTMYSQGEHIKLSGPPRLPDPVFLVKPDKIYISAYLYEAIDNFENEVGKKKELYKNCEGHHKSTENLHNLLTNNKTLDQKQMTVNALKENTMYSRSKAQLLKNILNDYDKFLKLISSLSNEEMDILERMEKYEDPSCSISGGGPFFISQILAGLFPTKYTVVHQNETRSMQRFQLTDINFEVTTARDYLYFNEICIELFKYFHNPFHFNLSYVHNFLWHHENYLSKGSWV